MSSPDSTSSPSSVSEPFPPAPRSVAGSVPPRASDSMRPATPTSPPAAPPDEKAGEPHATHRRPSLVLLVILTVVSAALDLWSKHWAEVNLRGFDPAGSGPKRFVVIPDYFDFVYAQNPGGAWSMLRSMPEIVRRPFFLVVSSIAIVFIVAIYVRVDARQRALVWGLPLALGGAIGNLVDRIRYGYVIDFIHVWVKRGDQEFHWPTFNVADIAIVVGVGLMAIDLFFSPRRSEPEPPASAPPSSREPTGEASPPET